VKKRRSSYHERERRKLTSEQHRIAISIDLYASVRFFLQLKNVYKSYESINWRFISRITSLNINFERETDVLVSLVLLPYIAVEWVP